MNRSAAVVETVDDAVNSGRQLSRAAAGSVKAAGDSLRGGKKRLTKAACRAAAQTDRLVQSNYWPAIGIAAAAGATIAALLSLRMHR